MNERIEKLAVEARQYAFGEVENSQDPTEWSTKYYNEMFEQKFAELIVFECVKAVMDGTKEGDHYAQRIENHFDNGDGGILHFGVEE
jgi:hypothetical protein